MRRTIAITILAGVAGGGCGVLALWLFLAAALLVFVTGTGAGPREESPAGVVFLAILIFLELLVALGSTLLVSRASSAFDAEPKGAFLVGTAIVTAAAIFGLRGISIVHTCVTGVDFPERVEHFCRGRD